MCNSMLKQSRPIKMLTFIPLARVERLDCDERLEKRCRKRTAAFCVCESVCVCVCVCACVASKFACYMWEGYITATRPDSDTRVLGGATRPGPAHRAPQGTCRGR